MLNDKGHRNEGKQERDSKMSKGEDIERFFGLVIVSKDQDERELGQLGRLERKVPKPDPSLCSGGNETVNINHKKKHQ